MRKFLADTATYLYTKHQADLTALTVVFPNRRAGLFFQKYLSELVRVPVFSPNIITISELAESLVQLKIIEKHKLVVELYKIYQQVVGSNEPLEDFYYWGEMMLVDFNDLDKYLVNAKQLFRNIESLKEIDAGFDFLTDKQLAYLSTFWSNLLEARESGDKEQFLTIWKKLFVIYTKYHESLLANKWAYEGMMYRELVEHLDEFPVEKMKKEYAFIGFNALNNCEQKLFNFLKVNSHADFFWDYDDYYFKAKSHEAARFIHENLAYLPQPEDFAVSSRNFSKLNQIEVVAVPGFSGQATYASHWIESNKSTINGRFDNTAVVLCDESLLVPLLNGVPAFINEFNITMGFPFKSSPVYALVKSLIDVDRNKRVDQHGKVIFYYRNVLALLNNQLLRGHLGDFVETLTAKIKEENKIYLSIADFSDNDILNLVFQFPEEVKTCRVYFQEIIKRVFIADESDDKLLKESLYQLYLAINRLHDSLFNETDTVYTDMSKKLFYQLLLRQLDRLTIPFEGEPLSGVQIMGFLETRTLDFDNLILLAFNDDKLPGNPHQHSFIPYSLRKGFGMPVTEQRNAMYAYYFYRLIQRAKKVTLVYDSRTEGISNGEVSRFMTQLKYEAQHVELVEKQAVFDFEPIENKSITVEKTPAIMAKLESYFQTRRISPSALNTYIDCKLKYFFKYIEGIAETDEVLEDIDHLIFGRIAHLALEELYKPYLGLEISKTVVEQILNDNKALDRSLRIALELEYFKKGNFNLNGRNLLVFDVIKKYVIRILISDIKLAPFELLGLEKEFENELMISGSNGLLKVRFGGTVDRLDKVGDAIRVVDYKTGKSENKVSAIEKLFSANYGRNKAAFQTLLYANCVENELDTIAPIVPAVYGARSVFTSEFDPLFQLNGGQLIYQAVAEEFNAGLKALFEEMINPEVPFMQVENPQSCRYCEFNGICCR